MSNRIITADNPLGTEKISKLIAKFAIPSVISMLVNALYNIVDQIFIGRGVGYLGNAATNVAFPFVCLSLAISLLIANGAAANMSLRLGEKKREDASVGFCNALVLCGGASILFVILGSIFLRPMLNMFGATEVMMDLAVDYTSIILFGLPFVMVTTVFNSVIRADGSPNFAMYSMLSGAVLNTVLDPIFIFTMGWGVKGAAYATIIGQIVGFAISCLYLKKFRNIDIKKEYFRIRRATANILVALGLSSFITQFGGVIVQIVMNNSLRYYGALSAYGSEIPLSAFGIVMKVNQILISIVLGIGIGSQPIIGYNYGAKNFDRVKKTYKTSVLLASVVTILGFMIFMFFPQTIINVFGQEDALYNEFALMCFRIFLFGVFSAGFQIVSSGYFQAVGKPIKSALLSLSRQVGFLMPLILIFSLLWGLNGILYAGPVADILAATVTAGFIFKEIRSLRTKQEALEKTSLTGGIQSEMAYNCKK